MHLFAFSGAESTTCPIKKGAMNMKKKTCMVLGLCLAILFALPLFSGEDLGHAASSTEPRLPGVRVLGGLSDKYEPVRFDHEKHVSLAGKCDACHHHANGAASSCRECHNLGPSVFKNSVVRNFMPCSGCHGALDPGNPAMPGLKVAYHEKCFACHRGMNDVGIDPKGCAELCHAKKTGRP
jgi:Class III cytochrome C family